MVSLFWSIAMMAVMYYICGLVFVQGTLQHLHTTAEDDFDPIKRAALQKAFSSVPEAMLSLFYTQTGGDWMKYYDALLDVGYLYSSLYLGFVGFSMVAFWNVITALFVEEAIEIARPDREEKVFVERERQVDEAHELSRMCVEADTDGSGKLSKDEFHAQIANPDSALRVYLEAEGLDVVDARLFYDLLRGCAVGEEEVDIHGFVRGLMKIRGVARSIDIQALMWQTNVIYTKIQSRLGRMEEIMGPVQNQGGTRPNLQSVLAL
jgi:hypothetical protein